MDVKVKTATIVELNDAFRQSFTGGQVMLTAGVNELERKAKAKLLNEVRNFTNFNKATTHTRNVTSARLKSKAKTTSGKSITTISGSTAVQKTPQIQHSQPAF